MKKDDFYLSLNILNILLCISMFVMFLVFFITCYIAPDWIAPSCLILLCILIKIFLLPLLFVTIEESFSNSTLSKMVRELKTNISNKKFVLLLALSYDMIMMLLFSLRDIIEYHFGWVDILAYEIVTLGGICMFYIALFGIWKIQDKLKL